MWRSRPIRTGLIIATVAAAMIAPTVALACTCTDWPSFEDAFAESEAVFRGTVTSITTAPPEYFEHISVSIAADAWWKGPASETVVVLTTAHEGICGFPFEVGSAYLVFANRQQPEGPLSTYLCDRSHEAWNGDPDIDRLGAPYTVSVLPSQWSGIKRLYQ